MSDTFNLKLPLIAPQQAQKHVTHNESLMALDRLVHLAVLDRDDATPPASPPEGSQYIVASSPTGAWAGKSGQIATFTDGQWFFMAPNEGWLVWVADEDLVLAYDGAQWVGLPVPDVIPRLGINTGADTTNRLSLSSPASLFNHSGNGHQLKINKAAETDTGSILFQTGYSGRAELGLTGDDDFRFKVSGNGSTWAEAIRLDRGTGRVSFPSGGVREQLTANRTYYIATTGLDTNAGLTVGTPFLTLQKAIDTIAGLDLAKFDVTIQVADGTYTGGVLVRAPFLGSGVVTIKGNIANPQNVIISRTSADAILVKAGTLRIEALTLQTSGTSSNAIEADADGTVLIGPGLRFGACTGHHISASNGAFVRLETGVALTIAGGAATHLLAKGGYIEGAGNNWTLTGTPALAIFARSLCTGLINLSGAVFSGASTGQRYNATLNGVINTSTGNAALFPGSTAGATATGGIYT